MATVATVCSLRGLREGVNYSVSVVAFNQLSESPPTIINDITMTGSSEHIQLNSDNIGMLGVNEFSIFLAQS